jgi:hypothetical protein
MSFSDTEQFCGKQVAIWEVGKPLADPATSAIKLVVNPYDDDPPFTEYFADFIKLPGLDKIDTLIIGQWGEAYDENSSVAINLLVQHKRLFSNLTCLFIGDLEMEEAEISWIQQSNISPIYMAFPKLTTLKLRGGEGLSLGNLSHDRLQTLIIESGGIDKRILEQIHLANVPELTHLELWLGDDNYGCNIGGSDIHAFLDGISAQFPRLSYLGLRNYYLSDELAGVIGKAGAPKNIETLDLSLGNLSDAGAEALIASDKLSHLKTLDLHHHYLTDQMMVKVAAAKIAPTVNLDDQEEPDEYDGEVERYIFVSE